MIWFNIKEIERKIIEDELSDKETLTYFLLASIGGLFGISSISYQDILTLTELFVSVAITIWGTFTIFNTNQNGDGRDFYKRFFPLAWVVCFRLLIFTFLALIPLTFVVFIIIPDSLNQVQSENTSSNEDWLFLIISAIVLVIFYLQLKNSFKRVSSKILL